jgi:CPA1 family monovalent cation:H+ antiporter
MELIERIETLLLVAAVVAMLTRRMRVPYSVGLVLTGAVLASLPHSPRVALTRDVIYLGLLPPLVFDAALFLPWRELRRELLVVSTIASIGLVLAAAVTAVGMRMLLGWPWISAAAFGVLIAATDPVAVIAIFKEAGATGRLRILVEAESLFNDGVAAVAFAAVVAMPALPGSSDGTTSAGSIALDLLRAIGGGVACGALVALAMRWLAGKAAETLVKTTFTTVAAYGAFLLAEHLRASGVVSTLTCGLIIGNQLSSERVADTVRTAIETLWEYIAFIANSMIFLLIGMRLAQQDFAGAGPAALVAIGCVLAGRAAAVYPIGGLLAASRWRVPLRQQHVLFWGGLRGALALALALSLPESMPLRDLIVTLAFAVVAFSIVVQGMTIAPLLRRLGEIGPGRSARSRGRRNMG